MSKKSAMDEYHLICRLTGESHGGFATLAGARQYAREENLEAWDIFHGNLLVERHEPRRLEFTEREYPIPLIMLPAGFRVDERRKKIKRGSPPN